MRTAILSLVSLVLVGAVSVGCSSDVEDDGEGGGDSDGCPAQPPTDAASCDLPEMTECRYDDADDCVIVFRCEPVYPEGGAPNEWTDLGREDPMCGQPSVVGTTHNGDCATADAFASQCLAEGGKLGDSCTFSTCAGPGVGATCFQAPPLPTPIEFSCEGLFNCAAGDVCSRKDPIADGCVEHACEPPPAACENDLSCDCLEANLPEGGPGSSLGCTEDANGNPTLVTSKM